MEKELKPEKRKNIFLRDGFILILIFVNSVLIFLQDFSSAPSFLDYFDNLFTLLFTIEMVVKIRTYGLERYWRSKWNRLDAILVIIALFSLLVELFNINQISNLEYLLVLRVLRLFKSLRIFKFIPNMGSIYMGLKNAVKASYLVIFSFIILLFIVSVLTCSLFKNIAPEYFATPLNSLYTVFRIFSIEGWYEIPDLIAERSTPMAAFLTKAYFSILLFVGGILGMSLINSIFVDAMVSDNNEALEKDVKELSGKIDTLAYNETLRQEVKELSAKMDIILYEIKEQKSGKQ